MSGELYVALATDIVDPENVTEVEEEKFINIGAIESGANVDISNDYQEVNSANRGLIGRFKVKTDVRFSTGICTWHLENVAKFLSGSKFEEDLEKGERKMIVSKDDTSPIVYLRFIHTKKDGSGNLEVNLYRATFDGDLNFVFNTDNPTTINYEFVGLTTNEGNYVEFIETFPTGEEEE